MKDIRRTMGELLSEEGLDDLTLLLKIKESWEDIAGKRFSSYTTPYRLDGDRLYVGVISHAVAQDIHYSEERIIEKLHGMGMRGISKIIIRNINLNRRVNKERT